MKQVGIVVVSITAARGYAPTTTQDSMGSGIVLLHWCMQKYHDEPKQYKGYLKSALEVTRVATDGAKDACSALYGACRRATFALGYTRLVTYTLASETGVSLKGAGYRLIGEAGGDRGRVHHGRAWIRTHDNARFDGK